MLHYAEQFGLKQVALIGYSMGGNLVLKPAGECGNAPAASRGDWCVPAMDLQRSADALHEPAQSSLRMEFSARHAAPVSAESDLDASAIFTCKLRISSQYPHLDEYIVAPNCGFAGADDYYRRAASARVIDRIAVPTLILHSLDDPFIRLLPETRAQILANPQITLMESRYGGHCGFLAAASDLTTVIGPSRRYSVR